MSEQAKILLVRPVLSEHNQRDRAVFEVLSYSLGLLVKRIALGKDYTVVDLSADSATRDTFEDAFRLYNNISIVIFLGHGVRDGDQALGRDSEVCIDLRNVRYGTGKNLYFVCCHAAKKLGPEAIGQRANCFLGFIDKVWLAPYGGEPIIAGCLLAFIEHLIEGEPPVKAWAKSQKTYTKWIKRLKKEREKLDPDWFVTVAALKWNMSKILLRVAN